METEDMQLSIQLEKEELNPLEKYNINAPIDIVVIPTFEITFKDDSGFGVYVVEDNKERTFSIKGTFISQLIIGQTYKVNGTVNMFKGEKQVSVKTIRNVKPVNGKGIISYLQTLKGLKTRALKIYDQFGDKSIDALIEDPIKVANMIKGISRNMVLNWKEQLEKMKESQYTMSALLGYGLTNKQSKKLYDKYNDGIVAMIEQNPYFLSTEVKGYGFLSCDRIARTMGYDPKSPFRIQEGLYYTLDSASSEGHCFLPKEDLIKNSIAILGINLSGQEMGKLLSEHTGQTNFSYFIGKYECPVDFDKLSFKYKEYLRERNSKRKDKIKYTVVSLDPDTIFEQLNELCNGKRIIIEENRVYIKKLYYDERRVAELVYVLSKEHDFRKTINIEKDLDVFLNEKEIVLEKKTKAGSY